MEDCILVCAGAFDEGTRLREGYMIAVDGGYARLSGLGIMPDMVIGDFDSLGSAPNHPHTVTLSPEKDDTDTLAALKAALGMGFRTFHIYGGMGGRLDHTLANIQCLAYLARRGAQGFMYGGGMAVTLIKNGSMAFEAGRSGTISVFSHTDISRGVYERGLRYTLDNATLYNEHPLGVSNEFTGAAAQVSVDEGELVVMYAQGRDE